MKFFDQILFKWIYELPIQENVHIFFSFPYHFFEVSTK